MVPLLESSFSFIEMCDLLKNACEDMDRGDVNVGALCSFSSFLSCDEDMNSSLCSYKSAVDSESIPTQGDLVCGLSSGELNRVEYPVDDFFVIDNNDVTNQLNVASSGVTNKNVNNICTPAQNIKIVVQNAQGIRLGGESEVNLLIKETNPQILIITEHWKKMESELPIVEGFKKLAKCRTQRKGGGVATWISNELGSLYSMKLEYGDPSIDEDIMWTCIPRCGMAICSVYMSPTEDAHWTSMLTHMDKCVAELKEKGLKVIIAGDLNCKLLTKEQGDREENYVVLYKKVWFIIIQ